MEALALAETRLCRSFRFHAAHYYRLAHLDQAQNEARFGDLAQPHSHDWVVTLWLTGPLHPELGTVMDLGLLDRVLADVIGKFDGGVINDLEPMFKRRLPTTEALAAYFADRVQAGITPVRLVRVRVAESDELWAEYEP